MSLTVNDQNLGHATAYGYAKSQGYTGTEEEFAELMASYATVAQDAAASAEAAAADALKAEGYAVGKQDGSDVGSGSPYYHNNAEYFKDQAASDAAHCDEVAESIPEDYSELSQTVEGMVTALAAMGLVVYNGQFYVNPDGNTLLA